MGSIWGSNKDDADDKEDEFLQNLEKKREEKRELKESTKERKLSAIGKIQKVIDLPLFNDYDTIGLNTIQRLTILQLLRKIGECEGEIPKEFWCDSCKSKEERVKDLIKRFRDPLEKKRRNRRDKDREWGLID